LPISLLPLPVLFFETVFGGFETLKFNYHYRLYSITKLVEGKLSDQR